MKSHCVSGGGAPSARQERVASCPSSTVTFSGGCSITGAEAGRRGHRSGHRSGHSVRSPAPVAGLGHRVRSPSDVSGRSPSKVTEVTKSGHQSGHQVRSHCQVTVITGDQRQVIKPDHQVKSPNPVTGSSHNLTIPTKRHFLHQPPTLQFTVKSFQTHSQRRRYTEARNIPDAALPRPTHAVLGAITCVRERVSVRVSLCVWVRCNGNWQDASGT